MNNRQHPKAQKKKSIFGYLLWFLGLGVLGGGAICFPGCAQPVEYKAVELHMGTIVEITVLGPDQEKLKADVAAAFGEVERVEGLMSSYREGSDVDRINRSAGGPGVVVDPEVFLVIERAGEISRWSDGGFDITVGGLRGLWSFDPEHPNRPTLKDIEQRLPLIGWEQVVLDRAGRTVGLKREGMRIDLGGIAKGYAVDRALEVLANRGVKMAMVNAGGDLRVLGQHGNRPWNVGIQDPRNHEALIASIPVVDRSVATSGDYEKFFILDNVRYSHIIVPQTGQPASSCQSVTVIAADAWQADALATAVFVLGPDRGMEMVEKLDGVETIIIDRAGKRLASTGVKNRFEWLE